MDPSDPSIEVAGEHPMRSRLLADLASFDRKELDRPLLKPASVALCVVLKKKVPSLLITRRAAGLRQHAGQWALPGGRRDPGESIEQASLRELDEETGISLPPSSVLGLLDDYATRSGYVMTPVVVWGGDVELNFDASVAEVASIHVVALSELDLEPNLITIPESTAPVIQLPILGRMVHAPTAAIIYQFCQLAMHGKTTRVAHFEQPVFAWN
jgi:8-oxo-dGTP pyrophosphatase MutT (NUDIX family)